MNHREITLGQVTYEISRVHVGERSVTELMSECFVRHLSEDPSFDEQHTQVV